METKDDIAFRDEKFSLSVTYKRKEQSLFSADQTFAARIEKKTGNGDPENPFRFEIEITNRGDESWTGVVNVALSGGGEHSRFFLPGYLYGNNNADSTLPPRLIKEFQRLKKGPVNPPCSPFWYMRSDELTHPVAVMFAGDRILGISGSPWLVKIDPPEFWEHGRAGFAGYNGFSCSVEHEAEIGFTAGYTNLPGVYTSPWEYNGYDARRQGCVTIQAGSALRFGFKVFSFASAHEDGLGRVLESVYETYHETPPAASAGGKRKAAEDISNAIACDAYNPGVNNYALIMMKPVSEDRPNAYEPKKRFAVADYRAANEGLIAWTNGAVIAVPLLQASYRLKKSALRTQAVKVIDEIVTASLNPATGIPWCAKIEGRWRNDGWWTPWIASEGVAPGHSSYIVGQSLYYILKAYTIEKAHRHEHAAWLAFAGKVIDTIAKTLDGNGAFPRFWDETTGAGSEYGAFSGCWAAAAMAKYAALAARPDLLPAVRKAEARYHADIERMECSYTPLDAADSPDSEGVLAYIRLAKILSELVADDGGGVPYLDRLRTGIDYALSYTFCHDVPNLAPPLGALGFRIRGGSITSVCNAVIHCMLNSILDEIDYYCRRTGNDYCRKRLADIDAWGLQTYNRSECQFLFGKKGWSSEYFCNSDRYMLDVRLPDGARSSLWFAYHPWATASVLEGICGDLWQE